MLRSFRLANHRSFRDEHELLLMPSYDNDRDVVPGRCCLRRKRLWKV